MERIATTERPRRDALPALTGLRILLAAHVLLFHFAPGFFGNSSFARNFARAGSSAIPGFFLLSGFILTYAHVLAPDRIDQPAGQFWLARFYRIYPAYFLAFLLSAPFALAQLRHTGLRLHTLVDTGLFLLLLQTWVPGLWSYWNYPAWSLSVEAFFYACFPLLAPWIIGRKWDWRGMLGAVWIAGLVAPAILAGSTRFDWVLAMPPLHLPEFVFGMILGSRRPAYTGHRGEGSDHERAWAWIGPIGAAMLIACYGSGWFSYDLIDHGLFAPLMGCVMWSLARGKGWFTYLLGLKPIVYLGEISYGVYIFQFPVFTGSFVVAKRIGLAWNTRPTFLICCAILVGVSSLSYELIEKRLRRAGMGYRERRLRAAG